MTIKLNKSQFNREEVAVWNEMKSALKTHNSYWVRKQFYPHNMDSWENEHKDLEHTYHVKLQNMVLTREKFEKEEIQRETEMEVAKSLLLMKKREEYSLKKRKLAEQRKTTNANIVPRRSNRISAR